MVEPEVEGVQEGNLVAFLKSNANTGEIKTATDQRAVVMTADLWRALTDTLAQRLSGELDNVLYAAGQTWGAGVFSEFSKDVSTAEKTLYHIRNMPLDDFKREFNSYLVRQGWGRFDIHERYDLIFVELFSSAYADMLGRREAMACSLMAGFFGGFFSEMFGVDFSCIELQCAAVGAGKCTFVVADSAVTGSVRKWQSKGRSYEDIVAAIGAKEYQGKK